MSSKLILICSDVSEGSTDIVCNWLNFYDKKFLRISYENIITIKSIIIKNDDVDIIFDIDDIEYKLSDFQSYWYRRSTFTFSPLAYIEYNFEGKDLSEKMNLFLAEEYRKMIELFKYCFNEMAVLNKFEDNYINKIQVLTIAKEIGLKIPDTYILNDKHLLDFRSEEYITKAISDFFIIEGDDNYYTMTQRISENECEYFSKSLIQREIKKKFEIRCFFFNRTFYSSAIFSQENTKTELDFRNYDYDNPNRVVPYKLPDEIEEKLLQLADRLNLKSGSYDIAYDGEGDYVLFEVNPVGQFEQVSGPCNYKIHQLIAIAL